MSDFDAKLAALQTRFRVRAGDEAVRLIGALAAGDRAELLRTSHAIAGSAGMFDFPALGEAALAVEAAIDAEDSDEQLAAPAGRLIAALEAIAQRV
jgi:HPt (histidine-containing phosphotransfer) domain-containing protein